MSSGQSVRISVVGAGLIGCRHADAVRDATSVTLSSIVDPTDVGRRVAEQHGVTHYESLEQMFQADKPDGVINATPNQMHVVTTLQCVEAAVPTLVEKPLASDITGAETIVKAGKSANVQLLTGHHRRHNPLIARAKEIIDAGKLGQISAAHGTTWFFKPDDYFDVDWRRKKGAGPVYLNLIHDIDMLRYLCGEIVTVQAMESAVIRQNEVEETAVLILKFASGALATVNVSDTVVAPWSWELTARENPVYPATGETCYQIGGTHGALALPNLALWTHAGQRSWWQPISATRVPFDFEDPLVRQVKQFAAVIRGEESPLVSAEEGLINQRVIEAVKQSAATGQAIDVS